jgi:hypothetical protein
MGISIIAKIFQLAIMQTTSHLADTKQTLNNKIGYGREG